MNSNHLSICVPVSQLNPCAHRSVSVTRCTSFKNEWSYWDAGRSLD